MENRFDVQFELMRIRPTMCMGDKSIFSFRAYLYGFMGGMQAVGGRDAAKAENDKLEEFRQHLQSRYVVNRLTGWEDILFFETGNEETALDKFWIEWDIFTEMTNEAGMAAAQAVRDAGVARANIWWSARRSSVFYRTRKMFGRSHHQIYLVK